MLGHFGAGRAEINQDGRAVATDDDVVGRDITMQEVLGVNGLEGIEKRRHDAIELGLPWRATEAAKPTLETRAFLEMQNDVARIAVAEVAVDAHDVRMIEARQRLCLGKKAVEAPAVVVGRVLGARAHVVAGVARREIDGEVFLDCDLPVERHLGGEIRNTESARAERTLDAVVAD